jgi:hypothetical protein
VNGIIVEKRSATLYLAWNEIHGLCVLSTNDDLELGVWFSFYVLYVLHLSNLYKTGNRVKQWRRGGSRAGLGLQNLPSSDAHFSLAPLTLPEEFGIIYREKPAEEQPNEFQKAMKTPNI